ncbi:MAG TPA: AEC family transporter [Treponema sp.]|nr:AEC family transporter [Treponema sp.]
MDVTGQVLVLFLLILFGYAARKARIMDDAALGHFSAFVANITLPALIVVSLQRPFSRGLLGSAAATLGLSVAVYAFSFAAAAVYPSLIRAGKKERGVQRYAIIFSNVGFMGFPVVEAVLGGDALFNLAIYNIPFYFLAFSVGAWLIARDGKRPLLLTWRTFVNPSVAATLVGIALFLLSVKLPAPLHRALKLTGDATSPLSMIVIGAILARMDPRAVVGRWRNFVTTAVRLVVLPAAVYAALYALGLRGLLLALPVLVVAMPVAANATLLANLYEGDTESASAMVFISTLACVATIPAIALLFAG